MQGTIVFLVLGHPVENGHMCANRKPYEEAYDVVEDNASSVEGDEAVEAVSYKRSGKPPRHSESLASKTAQVSHANRNRCYRQNDTKIASTSGNSGTHKMARPK